MTKQNYSYLKASSIKNNIIYHTKFAMFTLRQISAIACSRAVLVICTPSYDA